MLLRHQYLGIDMQIHNSQGIKLYKSTSGIEPKKPNHLKPGETSDCIEKNEKPT